MPTYNGTNNYNQINVAVPNGALEPVLNLPLAVCEIKRVAQNTMELQHNSDGSHQAGIITGTMIASNTITAANIAPNTITSGQVDSTVTTPAPGSITGGSGGMLASNTVAASNMANNSVATAAIQANAVTPAKLGGGSVAAQVLIADGAGNWAPQTISGAISINASGVTSLLATLSIPIVTAIDTNHVRYTATTWVTRSFSVVVDSQSVSTWTGGGVFTLSTGSYLIFGAAQTFNTGLTQLRLASAPASSPSTYTGVIYGLSSYAGLDTNVSCPIFGSFTVTDPTLLYQLQQYVTYSNGTDDAGLSVGIADKYGEFMLVKYA